MAGLTRIVEVRRSRIRSPGTAAAPAAVHRPRDRAAEEVGRIGADSYGIGVTAAGSTQRVLHNRTRRHPAPPGAGGRPRTRRPADEPASLAIRFDFFAPGGVALSNGAEVPIGVRPRASIVAAQGPPASVTTGRINLNYCPVSCFRYQ